jgi:hypothetical protein
MNYLLPCPSCGNRFSVSLGQAGQVVHCKCGSTIEVPTIRELRSLEVVDDPSSAAPAWSRRQGLIFLGSTITVLALIGIGLLWYLRPPIVNISASLEEPDLAAIQKEIDAVPPDENYMRYESVRPWPPTLFAMKAKQNEIATYLMPAADLISAFESGGSQFLTGGIAMPYIEKVRTSSYQNMIAYAKRRQLQDWMLIVGIVGVVGIAVAIAGLAAPSGRRKRPVPRSRATTP